MMLSMMVGFGGAGGSATVLVAGETSSSSAGDTGFSASLGSLTPAVTLGAGTVSSLLDSWTWDEVTYAYQCAVTVTAASNPGATLWTTISVGGVVKTSASAAYTYVGTAAVWTWASDSFGMVAPNSYNVIFT